MPKIKIVIAGGGTGGHVYPGIAIAQELKRLQPDCEITFVGTKHRIESRIVPKEGFPFKSIWVLPFSRRFHWRTVLFVPVLLVGIIQSFFFLRRYRPAVVVGTGGFVSGPVLVAAHGLGIPTLIQEQNSLPGITNKLFAKYASEIHVSFEQSRRYFKRAGVFMTGNPVRSAPPNMTPVRAKTIFQLDPQRPVLLVVGGSQGAHAINQVVGQALAHLDPNLQLIWQTGRADYEWVRSVAEPFAGRVIVRDFIYNMEEAYLAADVALCRAGATTIAELMLYGCPAILVPFPQAAENHQELNAQSLVEEGAAVLLRQSELTPETLLSQLQHLLDHPRQLEEMSFHLRHLSRPDAANQIAKRILYYAGEF
ncbi:MAG: undecaprenyldiphospho-muramoylpentapeptide beta-N-acetylglucosaminyltransferase [Gemmatimonadetes bacterium]|nr:MAG: undecaprenyldiphospho-muramoylpentapeptide beta-N-acetylglucosaminyltransferase [Gemmatimonadota bacterium]